MSKIRRGSGVGAQAGIKIAGGNTHNLRYADDTTLMAESEEELKSLLMISSRTIMHPMTTKRHTKLRTLLMA